MTDQTIWILMTTLYLLATLNACYWACKLKRETFRLRAATTKFIEEHNLEGKRQ